MEPRLLLPESLWLLAGRFREHPMIDCHWQICSRFSGKFRADGRKVSGTSENSALTAGRFPERRKAPR